MSPYVLWVISHRRYTRWMKLADAAAAITGILLIALFQLFAPVTLLDWYVECMIMVILFMLPVILMHGFFYVKLLRQIKQKTNG